MTLRSSLFAMAALIAMPIVAPAEVRAQELQFGSVAMDIPAVMHKRLTPLTQYLSEKIGRDVSLKLSPNMGAAIHEVASGN
ncbi:MAG TPA: phosphonate ABC transporter substrate-binding protein, partial [Gammaproteobacteria bacterium]